MATDLLAHHLISGSDDFVKYTNYSAPVAGGLVPSGITFIAFGVAGEGRSLFSSLSISSLPPID